MPREASVRKQTLDHRISLVAGDSAATGAMVADNLDDVAQAALRATGADGIAIALEQNGVFVCRARAGITGPGLGATVDSTSSSLSGQCLRTGEMLVCSDVEADPRVDAAVCRQLDLRALAVAPLRLGGRSIGLLEAFAMRPNAFSESALEVLQHLADAAVATVQHEYAPERVLPHLPSLEPLAAEHQYRAAALRERWAALFPRWIEHRPLVVLLLISAVLVSGYTVVRVVRQSRSSPSALATGPTSTVPVENPEQLRQAAEHGDVAAQYRLGLGLQRGELPARNNTEAFGWLQKAADQGQADAQYELGNVVLAQHDLAAAYAWYLAAGLWGNEHAQQAAKALAPNLSAADVGQTRFRIGEMYASGKGLPQNEVSAYLWLTLADAAGNPQAKQAMKELAARMSKAQVETATGRAQTANAASAPRESARPAAETAIAAASAKAAPTAPDTAVRLTPEPGPPAPQAAAARPDAPALTASAINSAFPSLPAPKVTTPASTPLPSQVVPGKLIKQVTPRYPEAARHSQIQGQVVLRAHLNEEGKVTSVHATKGNALLAQAAEEAVRQWVYTPYMLNGKPVEADVIVVVTFTR